MIASSSASTTRARGEGGRAALLAEIVSGMARLRKLFQKLVLRLLQLGNPGDQAGPLAVESIGVTLGIPKLPIGHGRLRHQRVQPRIVGFIAELTELGIEDRQLVTRFAQSRRNIAQSPLDKPFHGRRSLRDEGRRGAAVSNRVGHDQSTRCTCHVVERDNGWPGTTRQRSGAQVNASGWSLWGSIHSACAGWS